MAGNVGKIQQVIGPTVDLEFDSDHLPEILNAIRITDEEREILEEIADGLEISRGFISRTIKLLIEPD